MANHSPHPHEGALAYRPDIDGLMAIAVLSVVLFHAKLPFITGGFTGVDIFFVISGFLIASIIVKEHARGDFSIARFYERRIRRIFPALFAVILASAAIGWFVLSPGDYMTFARSAMAAMAFYSNFFFNRQSGYFAPAADTQPLLHTWSLGVEEQFYLVAPFALIALLGPLFRFRAYIFWALFAASLGVSIYGVSREAGWAFYLPHSRAFELMAGVALALGLVPAFKGRAAAEGAAWLGIVLIGVGVFGFSQSTPFPGVAALAPVAGAALIIHSGAQHQTMIARALSTLPAVFTGKISYSLYLWHWPLLAYAEYEFGAEIDWTQRLALIVIAFALSVVSYYWIEQPARRAQPRHASAVVFACGAVVMVLALALTQAILRTRGVPQRLAPEVAEFARTTPTKLDTGGLCGFESGGKSETVRDCPIGDLKAKDVRFVLWGDSHAGAISVDIAKGAGAQGIKGFNYGRGGCMPLFGLENHGRAFRRCLALPRRMDQLLKEPEIREIIIHARWGLYAEGERSAGEANTQPRIFDASSKDANRTAFAKLLKGTVERIRAAGKTVTVIGPVPELEVNLPAAMIKAKMRGRDADFSLSRAKFDERQIAVLPVLAELAKMDGVRVVYPHAILCDASKCRAEAGGRALYFDDDHLSPAGSAQLRGMIETIMKSIAQQTQDKTNER